MNVYVNTLLDVANEMYRGNGSNHTQALLLLHTITGIPAPDCNVIVSEVMKQYGDLTNKPTTIPRTKEWFMLRLDGEVKKYTSANPNLQPLNDFEEGMKMAIKAMHDSITEMANLVSAQRSQLKSQHAQIAEQTELIKDILEELSS